MKMTLPTEHLTLKEAYLSMFEFIDQLYRRTKSEELGTVLGDLSLLMDGTTADPAAWDDWLKCVERVRRGGVNASLEIVSPRE